MKRVKHMNFQGKVIDCCYANNMSEHKGFHKYAVTGVKVMQKTADDEEEKKNKETKNTNVERITEFDPEFLYVRVRAVTANIPNNNGDLFIIDELKRTFKTFINQRVFKNHKSDNVTNAVGRIVDAVWVDHPQDKEHPYVECLLEIDRKKDQELVRGIEKGYISDVSMGCRVEYSICSCCGNKAHTEREYCDCIKKAKGKHYCPYCKKKSEPHGIHEENYGVEFFELSFVTDGADREAVVKEIVASDAMTGSLQEKFHKVGQILVDSNNPVFQEAGIFLRKMASEEIISNKDMERAERFIDLIDSFIE